MLKLNQKGALDPIVIILLVIVLALGGYVGYTIFNKDNEEVPSETIQATQQATQTVNDAESSTENNDADENDLTYDEYLVSIKPSKVDIEELYFGSVAQFEFERDESFGSCVGEYQRENLPGKSADSYCKCFLDAGIKEFDGIARFAHNNYWGNNQFEPKNPNWYKESHENCLGAA